MTTLVTHIEPRPEFAAILRRDERYATGDAGGPAERLNGAFDRLMLQSGLDVQPRAMLLLCIAGAIAFGGTVFVLFDQPLWAAAWAIIGAFLPLAWPALARQKCQKQILEQMPVLLDTLSRTLQTGRTLEQSLEAVSAEAPAPIGHELRLCVRRLQMGLDLSAAVRELPERTGLASVSVLVSALSLHHQTGGDLIDVLERLATAVRRHIGDLERERERAKLLQAAAAFLIALPPLAVFVSMLRDPSYLTQLQGSPWGHGLMMFALGLHLGGVLWVLRIVHDSRRA